MLVDGQAGRQRPQPAHRVHRAVVGGEQREPVRAPQRRRQRVARDELGGEAVGPQRGVVGADVVGLRRVEAEAQQAGDAEVLGGADLVGGPQHLVLRGERGRVHAARAVVPEGLDAAVVHRRGPGDEEAAVAPRRAAADHVGLEDEHVGARRVQAPGEGDPADPGADHADVAGAVAVQRRTARVGLVLPERDGAHGASASACARPRMSCAREVMRTRP